MDKNIFAYYPQFNIFADDFFKTPPIHPHGQDSTDLASLYPEALRKVIVHGNPVVTTIGRVPAIGGVHGASSLDDYVNPSDDYDII